MRKTEVPEGNCVPGCSPDHSTIRPKIRSVKSQPSPKDKSERLASRRKVVSSGFHSLVVWFFFAAIEHFPNKFCTRLSEKPNFRRFWANRTFSQNYFNIFTQKKHVSTLLGRLGIHNFVFRSKKWFSVGREILKS